MNNAQLQEQVGAAIFESEYGFEVSIGLIFASGMACDNWEDALAAADDLFQEVRAVREEENEPEAGASLRLYTAGTEDGYVQVALDGAPDALHDLVREALGGESVLVWDVESFDPALPEPEVVTA